MNDENKEKLKNLKRELHELLDSTNEYELSEIDAELLYTLSFDPQVMQDA